MLWENWRRWFNSCMMWNWVRLKKVGRSWRVFDTKEYWNCVLEDLNKLHRQWSGGKVKKEACIELGKNIMFCKYKFKKTRTWGVRRGSIWDIHRETSRHIDNVYYNLQKIIVRFLCWKQLFKMLERWQDQIRILENLLHQHILKIN